MKALIERLRLRLIEAAIADDGMSTAEYAIGTIAAAAFAAVLYAVVTPYHCRLLPCLAQRPLLGP